MQLASRSGLATGRSVQAVGELSCLPRCFHSEVATGRLLHRAGHRLCASVGLMRGTRLCRQRVMRWGASDWAATALDAMPDRARAPESARCCDTRRVCTEGPFSDVSSRNAGAELPRRPCNARRTDLTTLRRVEARRQAWNLGMFEGAAMHGNHAVWVHASWGCSVQCFIRGASFAVLHGGTLAGREGGGRSGAAGPWRRCLGVWRGEFLWRFSCAVERGPGTVLAAAWRRPSAVLPNALRTAWQTACGRRGNGLTHGAVACGGATGPLALPRIQAPCLTSAAVRCVRASLTWNARGEIPARYRVA